MKMKLLRCLETSRTNHSATLSNVPEEDVKPTRANLKTRIFVIILRFLINTSVNVDFFVALRPNVGRGLLILEVSTSHTTTHHSR